jgi:hypothetical protein
MDLTGKKWKKRLVAQAAQNKARKESEREQAADRAADEPYHATAEALRLPAQTVVRGPAAQPSQGILAPLELVKPPLKPTNIIETVGKFTNPRKALQKAVDTVKAASFVPHPEERELLQYIAAASARGLQGEIPVKTALLNLT